MIGNQERANAFQEEYRKLVEKHQCQHIHNPIITAEGRIIVQVTIQVDKLQATLGSGQSGE